MLTRRRVSHTPSRFLSFLVDGAVCTLHAALFSFFLSARRPSSWEIYEAACIPHAASLSFFFSLMGVEPAPILVRFPPKRGDSFFFFPRLYHQRGWCMNRPPRSLRFPPFIGFFFFCGRVIDEGAAYNPPAVPSLVYPSEMGGFFFVLQLLNTQGQCITHTLPLVYPIPSYVLSVVNVLNEL